MRAPFPAPVPEIPVKDVAASAAYYRDRLGFTVDWGDDGLGLYGVSRGDCRLFLANEAFREGRGNSGPVTIWLNLTSREDVDDLHRAWTGSGARVISAPESKPWGLHEFTAADPDGNLFRAFHDFATPERQRSMPRTEAERRSARLAAVDEHVRGENAHDLDAVMATFGADARYDDAPWGDRRSGRDGVAAYYRELLSALPDLEIDVRRRHAGEECVVLEVVIRGTHLGPWRGLPATGRRLEFPLCGVFEFDADDRLAGERIYYDRGAVLRQLGLFREPERGWGRIAAALGHPVTIARAYLRRASR